jgi:hypothetical protein
MEEDDIRTATLYLDPPPDYSRPVTLGTTYDPEGEHRGWRPVYVGQTIRPLIIRDREHRRSNRSEFDRASGARRVTRCRLARSRWT